MTLLARLLLVAAVLVATGCASTTEILRTVNESRPAEPAHSLIVVGVTTDDSLRKRYEDIFVDELRRAGIRGVPSSALIPSMGGLTMPELREHMTAGSGMAQAVIHVQLVELVSTGTWLPTDIPADAAPASRDVGGISVTLNAPARSAPRGAQTAVELEVNLYALPERTLLWTALTRTHEANSLEKVARSHARTLIREMIKGGLLAPGS